MYLVFLMAHDKSQTGDRSKTPRPARRRRGLGLVGRLLARPQVLLAGTFVGLIALGTLLLQLPAAYRGEPVSALDAFFTATSAVCVTGLITVDTATAWTQFGQTVILVLFQLGGLGVMTFAALAAEVLRLRVPFSSQAALRETFLTAESHSSVRSAIWRIAVLTFVAEALGAICIYVGLGSPDGPRGDWYDAVFISVSAFCNAGFSVYSDSLVGLRESQWVVWPVMILITLGGLGYPVLFEVSRRAWRRLRRQSCKPLMWSLHARVVLLSSLALTGGGAVLLLISGGPTLGDDPVTRTVDALFQSVTARTAGFNTVPIGALPLPALLLIMPLMFVGGAPGSCAGGVKTTSAVAWLARVWARLRGHDAVSLLGRRLPQDLLRRAALVISVAALWNAAGVILLVVTEGGGTAVPLSDLMFEQLSAFGTVGLSTGVTPELSVTGRLWIIASMFVGRVGPLTLALAVARARHRHYEYPVERVMIG